MKNKTKIEKKGLLAGAVVGAIIFAIVGFMPGSFIGGLIGLNLAKMIFGLPLNSELAPRLLVAASMVMGVMVSALITILGAALVGMAGVNVFKHIGSERKSSAKVALKG